MSRRILFHERLGGLVPYAHPVLPLSCPCVPPTFPLAQDNYQLVLLPKCVAGGLVFPRWTPAANVPGWDPRDRPCRAATQELGWLLSKAGGCSCQSCQERRTVVKTTQMMTAGCIYPALSWILQYDFLRFQCYTKRWYNIS